MLTMEQDNIKYLKKTYFLGLGISVFSEDEYYRFINEVLESSKTHILYGYTLLLMPVIKRNPDIIKYCNSFDLLVTDGRGYYLFAKLFGLPLKYDLSIPKMIYTLLELANIKGYSVLLFGGKESTNKKAINNLKKDYPNARILEGINGYYDLANEDIIVDKIASEKPDILLIANSSPKKEKFAFFYKDRINAKVIVPCGGMVDVFAGEISLTPAWLKKLGFAWLYRFLQEPVKRFNNTYSVLNMAIKILLYYCRNKNRNNFISKNILEII